MTQIIVEGSCELGWLVVHERVSSVCCRHSVLPDHYDWSLESRTCASASVLEEQVWRSGPTTFPFHIPYVGVSDWNDNLPDTWGSLFDCCKGGLIQEKSMAFCAACSQRLWVSALVRPGGKTLSTTFLVSHLTLSSIKTPSNFSFCFCLSFLQGSLPEFATAAK